MAVDDEREARPLPLLVTLTVTLTFLALHVEGHTVAVVAVVALGVGGGVGQGHHGERVAVGQGRGVGALQLAVDVLDRVAVSHQLVPNLLKNRKEGQNEIEKRGNDRKDIFFRGQESFLTLVCSYAYTTLQSQILNRDFSQAKELGPPLSVGR